MEWQTRRKILYALALLIMIAAVSVYMVRDILFPVPTCMDKKQNGYEVGIDCGGVCAVRCSSEVAPLSVLWTRIIKTSATTYDVVAMVSNKNINHSAHSITYFFTIYNEEGRLIQTIKGTTVSPISTDFPIIEQSVSLTEVPKSVSLKIEDGAHYNVHEKPTSPTVSISGERYEPGQVPRVYVTVQNRKRMTITDLPVKVILFDQNNNAYAVGETIIPTLGKEEIKEVTFTWSSPLPYPPLRIRAYPIFDPFLSIE